MVWLIRISPMSVLAARNSTKVEEKVRFLYRVLIHKTLIYNVMVRFYEFCQILEADDPSRRDFLKQGLGALGALGMNPVSSLGSLASLASGSSGQVSKYYLLVSSQVGGDTKNAPKVGIIFNKLAKMAGGPVYSLLPLNKMIGNDKFTGKERQTYGGLEALREAAFFKVVSSNDIHKIIQGKKLQPGWGQEVLGWQEGRDQYLAIPEGSGIDMIANNLMAMPGAVVKSAGDAINKWVKSFASENTPQAVEKPQKNDIWIRPHSEFGGSSMHQSFGEWVKRRQIK